MRKNPNLYEINARLYLDRLSRNYGAPVSLAQVPEAEWGRLKDLGFDMVWLMGVWQRSPLARREAVRHGWLRDEYDRLLPGWTESDVGGSPYAIYAYTLDGGLGAKGELARLRRKLNKLGLGLIVDFVANHVAMDHPWTLARPEWFVRGTPDDVREHPGRFFSTGAETYLAHGRDPYFSPWTDTAQVNFYSPGLRQVFTAQLEEIARVADGVRCDMAMLGLNSVFERVWGAVLRDYPRPATEFWTEAIADVRAQHPEFIFLAEAYWDLEPDMQRLGFDFVYDKTLYDRLRAGSAGEVRRHLLDPRLCQPALTRFIENHDELRAVSAFGLERSRAAAVVMATLPGLHLYHDGQLEGKSHRIPIQLVREPPDSTDPALSDLYRALLRAAGAPAFHDGEWEYLESCPAWPGNSSCDSILAWMWRLGDEIKIVAVNYSPEAAQGRVRLPVDFPGETVQLRDELTGSRYESGSSEVSARGLYVALGAWGSHILSAFAG